MKANRASAPRQSVAAAQRRFAAENAATADRLEAGGFGWLATVYREAAREHEATARRLDTAPAPEGR